MVAVVGVEGDDDCYGSRCRSDFQFQMIRTRI